MAATAPPLLLDDVERAVDQIVARVGPRIAVGLPLGLGNPAVLVNALYRRVAADPGLHLRILTALSLEKPAGASPLERAFLGPFIARVYGDCPDLDYVAALRAKKLPPNVEVCEFYFRPGSQLGNPHAQQHYISSNYTHAARDVFNQGCNVAAQLVARREVDGASRYSLSCNPDTSPELIGLLRASGRPHVTVAVVNQNLPYMVHDAEAPPGLFDLVVEHPRYTTTLFSTPKQAVGTADHLIGLHASSLVRDGGTLQVGIGALGDAVVHALTLRQRDNAGYRGLLDACGASANSGALIEAVGGAGPFERGLYGASEMLVDGFLRLQEAGILKREVYDFWALQQLVNEGACDPQRLDAGVLDALEALGVRVLRTADFQVLQHHGLFSDATRYDQGYVVAPDGTRVIANLADPQARRVIGERCLGARLRHGLLLHGAFFLGPASFYRSLREMSEAGRARICMTGVDKINQLDRNPRLYRAQRRHARFLNSGLMVTLSGAVCSDGLADGRVVSGVGGQFNFVDMAQHLPDGRSVLLVRAMRDTGEGAAPSSNIVFNYAHLTIPRHLRDLVVTEYGIADLRSRTDSEVAKALLNIADSRFQDELLAQVQKAGKVEAGYRIPDAYRNNLPQRLDELMAAPGRRALLPAYPLGCDFTPQELVLTKALRGVKAAAAEGKLRALWKSLKVRDIPPAALPYLERLQLVHPASLQDRVAQRLLVRELRKLDAV
ncbi:MAG TPA: acetyl-CoA hydrolase/transferase C-terminal domain-containing protein [Solimonas sp.]|nr:acetyl-CoA hydrolase/transferase C-terminal domain-containing protein [Solimonas sp.]